MRGQTPTIEVVLVHGIRTSATMWRAQVGYLQELGYRVTAVDLPGHGTRMAETFTLSGAMETIDTAVRAAASRAHVLLVGHSLGGLLCTAYVGAGDPPPVAGFIAASCTAFPRGAALTTYRALAGTFNSLPDQGMWLTKRMLAATLPEDTRADFGAGGYALAAQDTALRSLAALDLRSALTRIMVPTWFINGQYDQLRVSEKIFSRLVAGSELIVIPRATHLVSAMRPAAFNAAMKLALVTLERDLAVDSAAGQSVGRAAQ
ncbi:alpha/beta fold hydrolase [Microbacterium sp. NC79]|uniref:alpha/beta fold hydrolase n=1 Tax=Microbacterium sp. NC79 TaxID=2851009 RepID=UPI001C2BDE08|nr:alpha/beta hydrolase [Microbacterium sp. NC79]MBV0895072.1 alpha/beta hydrolase [Microbacterium sp. NC79]